MGFEDATRDYELQEEPQATEEDLILWEFINKFTERDDEEENDDELNDYEVRFYYLSKIIPAVSINVIDLGAEDIKAIYKALEDQKKAKETTSMEEPLQRVKLLNKKIEIAFKRIEVVDLYERLKEERRNEQND